MQQLETGVYFRLITDKLHAKADADLKAHGLTMTQSRVLCFLSDHDGEATQKEIEEFLSVAHPTVVGIVSRLEQNGFITFHPDSADKRNKVVVLTEKAVRVDKEMKEIIRRQDEKLFASLSQEQVKELTFLLQTIYENLNTEEEDTPC